MAQTITKSSMDYVKQALAATPAILSLIHISEPTRLC